MRDKIIIIEDDAALAAGLGRALASQQRDIRTCGKLADARHYETVQSGSAPCAGEHAASQKSDTGNRSMPGEIPLRFSVHGVLCRGKAGGAQQDGAEAVEDLY